MCLCKWQFIYDIGHLKPVTKPVTLSCKFLHYLTIKLQKFIGQNATCHPCHPLFLLFFIFLLKNKENIKGDRDDRFLGKEKF